TVRLKSTENNLLKDDDVTVASDGTWEASYDLSDYEPGVNFTASAVDNRFGDTDTDGKIVEQQTTTTTKTPTETTTKTPTETTTATPEPTTTTTSTPEPTTTTTTGGGPGFGIAVSIVALLGAALVALRRRD
ncbi:MAG: BGTF surface domain-containing protein, partial [Haloglomus sp.]